MFVVRKGTKHEFFVVELADSAIVGYGGGGGGGGQMWK